MWIERPHSGPVRPSVSSRLEHGAGGDHQHVVLEPHPVDQPHAYWRRSSTLSTSATTKLDPVAELGVARAHDLSRLGEPERHEQEPRLVHVDVVAVDDRDARRLTVQPIEAVRHERASGSTAENDDPVRHRITNPHRSDEPPQGGHAAHMLRKTT